MANTKTQASLWSGALRGATVIVSRQPTKKQSLKKGRARDTRQGYSALLFPVWSFCFLLLWGVQPFCRVLYDPCISVGVTPIRPENPTQGAPCGRWVSFVATLSWRCRAFLAEPQNSPQRKKHIRSKPMGSHWGRCTAHF